LNYGFGSLTTISYDYNDRSPLGLSMAAFNPVVLGVHTKIDEKKAWEESKKAI
jgi:hypothetical protein